MSEAHHRREETLVVEAQREMEEQRQFAAKASQIRQNEAAEKKRLEQEAKLQLDVETFHTVSSLFCCFNDTSLLLQRLPTDVLTEVMTRVRLCELRSLSCVNTELNTKLQKLKEPSSPQPPSIVIYEGLKEVGEEIILSVRDRDGTNDYYYSYGYEYAIDFKPIIEPHVLILEANRKGTYAPVFRHEFLFNPNDKKYTLLTPDPVYRTTRRRKIGEQLWWEFWHPRPHRSLNFNLEDLSHPTTPQVCQVVLSTRNETSLMINSTHILEVQLKPQDAPKRSDSLPPCFLSGCRVKMADETFKDISELKVGDHVASPVPGKSNRVQQVVVTAWNNKKAMVDLGDGMFITRGHPIFVNGTWLRPDELFATTTLLVNNLYNFILEDEHVIIVGSQENQTTCSTLGKYCGDRLASLYPEHCHLFGPDFLQRLQEIS